MSPVPPELAAVNDIFIAEVATHLEALRAAASAPPLDDFEKSRRGLENRFHVIRGGAGFLQHTVLAQLAERGERLFRESKEEGQFRTAVMEKLPELVTGIAEALARIQAD